MKLLTLLLAYIAYLSTDIQLQVFLNVLHTISTSYVFLTDFTKKKEYMKTERERIVQCSIKANLTTFSSSLL